MRLTRRKQLIRTLQRAALVLVLLDAVGYFAALRPLERKVTQEHERFTRTRERVRLAQARAARLESFQAAFAVTDDQMSVFLREHLPPRRRSFSHAARLIRRLSEASGLRLGEMAYRLDSGPEEPFQRLGLEMDVEGPFPDLLKFAHALETATDLLVVRDFSFEPLETGTVGLRIKADMYIVP